MPLGIQNLQGPGAFPGSIRAKFPPAPDNFEMLILLCKIYLWLSTLARHVILYNYSCSGNFLPTNDASALGLIIRVNRDTSCFKTSGSVYFKLQSPVGILGIDEWSLFGHCYIGWFTDIELRISNRKAKKKKLFVCPFMKKIRRVGRSIFYFFIYFYF